jgi:hypothetical protein
MSWAGWVILLVHLEAFMLSLMLCSSGAVLMCFFSGAVLMCFFSGAVLLVCWARKHA